MNWSLGDCLSWHHALPLYSLLGIWYAHNTLWFGHLLTTGFFQIVSSTGNIAGGFLWPWHQYLAGGNSLALARQMVMCLQWTMHILLSLFSEYESQPQLEGSWALGGWLSWAGQVHPGKGKHGDSPSFVGRSGVGASQDSLCEATGKTQALKRFSKERHRLGDSGRKWVATGCGY